MGMGPQARTEAPKSGKARKALPSVSVTRPLSPVDPSIDVTNVTEVLDGCSKSIMSLSSRKLVKIPSVEPDIIFVV
jgi:hypothetical protein